MDVVLAMQKLDRREALTFVITEILGGTQRDVAAVFEISRARAWQIHTRALHKLEQALRRQK